MRDSSRTGVVWGEKRLAVVVTSAASRSAGRAVSKD